MASPRIPFHMAMGLDADTIAHGFFTREGGVSKGIHTSLNCGPGSDDDLACVMENRARVEETLGLDAGQLVTLYQHHSADVVEVTSPWSNGDAPKADGMVTSVPGIALGILTADCTPVLFADAQAGVVGAAHAGWKGALGGVLENTLDAMAAKGAARETIHVAIGPTISQQNYEVGPEFQDRFCQDDPSNAAFFVPSEKSGHHKFDLPCYVQARLRAAGVRSVNDLGVCTYSEENGLFSYRRATHLGETGYGRNISVIALKG